jgi:hypothetical protein
MVTDLTMQVLAPGNSTSRDRYIWMSTSLQLMWHMYCPAVGQYMRHDQLQLVERLYRAVS